MDYPLTDEQIKTIKDCLGSSSILIYGFIKENQREALNFLIAHRFVVNGSQIAINAYSNQFFPVASTPEILRQITNENTRILKEREKAERAERRNSRISVATLIIGILTLLATIASMFL